MANIISRLEHVHLTPRPPPERLDLDWQTIDQRGAPFTFSHISVYFFFFLLPPGAWIIILYDIVFILTLRLIILNNSQEQPE